MSKQIVPEPPYPYRHRIPVQMRFNDIDIFGHLNNSVYLQFMDLGKAEYFRQFMPGGRLDAESLGLVIANVNIDFVAPALLNESLEVLTAVASIGCKSLVLDQRVVESGTDAVKAVAKVTMVCYNPKTGATEAISPDWRLKISTYEGRDFE